jgi:hypothetical protein
MAEPNIQSPLEFQYYVARHGIHSGYDKPRSIDQLQADMNVAHDNLKKLVREKDWMQRLLQSTQHRLDVASWKIWALGIIVTGEGAVIGWLVAEFLARIR